MHKRRWLMSGALAVAGCLCTASAQAAYLYWSTVEVKTQYVNICMSFARDTLNGLGYQNVHVSAVEVAGSKNGAYVAITCLGTPSRATAVVMATGDQGPPVLQARDAVKARIAGMVRFD